MWLSLHPPPCPAFRPSLPLPAAPHPATLQASPLMFATSQQYFNMAAILIFAHDENGSAGIILNRCALGGAPKLQLP